MKEQYMIIDGINVVLSQGNPPDWILDRAEKLFGVDYSLGVVIFTYGNVIYCKKKIKSQNILEHELVHVKQQTAYQGGPDAWWGRFFKEPEFRLEQELEAYQRQYRFIVSELGVAGRITNLPQYYLDMFAKWLSSKQYGEIISYADALKEIENGICLSR